MYYFCSMPKNELYIKDKNLCIGSMTRLQLLCVHSWRIDIESCRPAYSLPDYIEVKQKVGVRQKSDYVKELPFFNVQILALFTLITRNCTSIGNWLKTMYLEARTYTQRVGSSNSNLICLNSF